LTRGSSDPFWFLAQIGRWFNPRTPNATIEHYKKAVGYMKGVEGIQRMFDELLLRRKGHGSEQAGLRRAYLSPKWDYTNQRYSTFVMGLFTEALDGDEAHRASWPTVDRFEVGMEKINRAGKGGVVQGLLKWAKDQRNLRGAGVAAAGN
jgi:hypothetical protein